MPAEADFHGGSDGKESAYNAGDPVLISGLRRSPTEGNGNPLQLHIRFTLHFEVRNRQTNKKKDLTSVNALRCSYLYYKIVWCSSDNNVSTIVLNEW